MNSLHARTALRYIPVMLSSFFLTLPRNPPLFLNTAAIAYNRITRRILHTLRKLTFSCVAVLIAVLPLQSHDRPADAAVAFSKAVPHYARDVEFYYQKPHQEVLAGILRTFDAQGVLTDTRKQLALAAFFAQVLRMDATTRQRLLPPPDSLGRNGRRTLAWAVHLAQLADENELIGRLLSPEDTLLRDQIARSPAPLAAWDIRSEQTVLHMYWMAFFASGDTAFLDSIINTALQYAHLKAAGMQHARIFAVCTAAAASLYELAPRHPAVTSRLTHFLARHSGPEAETLRAMLHK